MLNAMFWFAAGLFVGWNTPVPQFAKGLKQKVLDWFKK